MGKVLVAYFSASGTTANVAKRLAKVTQADLFEIRPQVPYTEADLNWTDRASRSSMEMRDPDCRPALADALPNTQQYDVIFVGFPVWWYREPSIIDTFIQGCELEGRTVVPFATSGGSEIGPSGENMQALAPKAKVQTGQRFDAKVSEEELSEWAAQWL